MRVLEYAAPIRKSQIRRCSGALPYGCYFVADGSIVLFDRRYRPIYTCDRNGRVAVDDPRRWVRGILAKVWLYDGSCTPRRNPEIRHRVTVIRDRWSAAAAGLHVPAAELLPVEWIVNRKPPLAA
jgi:hypothetical protein